MTAPVDTVKRFYDRLAAGDIPGLVGLMTDDIEWITMLDFNLDQRGPQPVVEKVLTPLMEEWLSFSPDPAEFITATDDSTVISLGSFTCIHRATSKRASARARLVSTRRQDRPVPAVHRHPRHRPGPYAVTGHGPLSDPVPARATD